MSTELYRQTKLGDSLVSALEDLLDNDKITGELAIKVLSEVRRVSLVCAAYVARTVHSRLCCTRSSTRCGGFGVAPSPYT